MDGRFLVSSDFPRYVLPCQLNLPVAFGISSAGPCNLNCIHNWTVHGDYSSRHFSEPSHFKLLANWPSIMSSDLFFWRKLDLTIHPMSVVLYTDQYILKSVSLLTMLCISEFSCFFVMVLNN